MLLSGRKPLRAISLYLRKAASVLPTCTKQSSLGSGHNSEPTESDMGALNKRRCFMVIIQQESPEDVVHGPYHRKSCNGGVGAVAIWAGSIEKHGLVHFLCLFSPACFGMKVQE